MMRKSCLIFFLLISSPMSAEVEKITITWNSYLCDEKCGELIEKKLREIKGIESVNVNQPAGLANITWGTAIPFSYTPIKTAMRLVGPAVSDIRVRVRGKIREEGKQIALYSLGDNTRFVIVSPIRPLPGGQAVQPNPALRELNPDLRERLLQDARLDKIMVIEGPLYRPARSPPLMIVTERIQIEKKKEPKP